jgi:coniferyl-aldehyde dehydrogenase
VTPDHIGVAKLPFKDLVTGVYPMTTPHLHSVDPLHQLESAFHHQRLAFREQPYPDASARQTHLETLARLLTDNVGAIVESISADFGHRSSHETQLLEIMPAIRSVKHAKANVARWMRPERKKVSVWFKFGRSCVVRQPLGVVGIIVPWNYPLLLAVGPLAAALAAGNRVMLKLSEYSPNFGQRFSELISSCFPTNHIAVINGGVEVARAFAAKPFDHLLYTGGTAVGREVMKAAAENLTPVTLELGGKSPAIVGPDYPVEAAAQRIMWGKCLNAGQSCIAPDYVLIPADKEQAFAEAAQSAVQRFFPDGAGSSDYSAIVSLRHYQRLLAILADAHNKGAQSTSLMEGQSESSRKMPPTLLRDMRDDMVVMQDEIFGPLLPLIPYQSIEDTLRFVSDRPRPLALYYFDRDRRRIKTLLQSTISGGVTINDTMLHVAQDDLPFGGIGPSGMGNYHGEDGFLTFSKRKGVFLQSRYTAVGMLNPPYGTRAERIINWMQR